MLAAGAAALEFRERAAAPTSGEDGPGAGLTATNKSAAFDLVTEADVLSQCTALSSLAAALPADVAFVAEESDESGAVPESARERMAEVAEGGAIMARRFVTVDPIDGTSNFFCGGADWSVAAAVVEDGRPATAAIYLPVRGDLMVAARGEGCWVNGRLMDCRKLERPLQRCLVAAEMGAFVGRDNLQRLVRLPDVSLGLRNVFSTTGNTADFVSGITGAFLHLRGGWIWDFAPTALCVEESGAVACDAHGAPLSWNNVMGTVRPTGVIFAANASIRDEVLRVLHSEEWP